MNVLLYSILSEFKTHISKNKMKPKKDACAFWSKINTKLSKDVEIIIRKKKLKIKINF